MRKERLIHAGKPERTESKKCGSYRAMLRTIDAIYDESKLKDDACA
jgi:hypothetical protein